MKKHFVAMGLLMSLAATGAAADAQHYATASTKQAAKHLATAEAQAIATTSGACYRPARQVRACQPVEGGFRCKAETSNDNRTCRRAGWVNVPSSQAFALTWANRPLASEQASPWTNKDAAVEYSPLYGAIRQASSGPPLPPPFPNN